MVKNTNYVSHKKSKVKINGKPHLPLPNALVEGEIAINYAENVETLSIKNDNEKIITFSSDNYYTEKKLGSAFTSVNSAKTVTDVIEENEEIISVELNDLRINKLDVSAYTPTDLSNYYTKEETNAAINEAIIDASGVTSATVQTLIDKSISGKTNNSDFNAHTSDAIIHHIHNNKIHLDSITSNVGTMAYQNTSSYYNITDIDNALNNKANISDIPSVNEYADSVKYDSNNKTMTFYHGGTNGTAVYSFDASPFLIDGMVQNVEIKDVTSGSSSVTCLVIDFNTDAGKQDINIPLTEIFDPSNYYTKSETSGATELSFAFANKLSVSDFNSYSGVVNTLIESKALQSDLNALNHTVTAHTANTNIHITSAERTAWNAKSDFSGSYNDLTDKPTIPSKTSELINDSDFATSEYVNTKTNDMATQTWVGQQGYLTSADISGKQDVSGMTAYTEVSTFQGHTTNINVHVTTAEKNNWNTVNNKLNTSDFNAYSADVNTTILNKVDKISGKGLSTNDFTDTNKVNLDSLATNIATISGITSTKVSKWDGAATNSHTHSNKTYLDGITGSVGTMAYENVSSYSSATEVNTALGGKSNTGHTHDDRYYTEAELTGSSTTVVVAKAASATTAASANAVAWNNVSGKPSTFTPSAHNQASNTITAMTSYSKPSSTSAIATGDTLNAAIGKLEKALDGKQASGSYLTATTTYASSSSVGGAATSAEKLTNTNAIGSGTQPVFFTANGVPSACTYSLNKTVPSDAVFTDTNTKVTSVGNHYTPTATSADTKSANASSTSELAWGSAVVTGVTLSGDAKGHITSVTVNSGKLKTPVTGVTLASGTNNGTVKLTVNGSATDNIAVKGLGTAAYKAEGYFAGSGHTHSAYVPTGRTITTASGLTGGGNLSADRTIGLAATGTAGTYGPTAHVTGSNNTTIKVPQITTDAYGRVTSVSERTYTSVDHTYTVNNGTFTISGAGTAVASTSANASANTGLNIKGGSNVTVSTGTNEITIAATDTTYSTGSSAILSAGTDTTQRVWRADQLKGGMDALYQPKGSYVTTGRKVSAGTGLSGGGDLSTDRTISLATTGTAGTYKQVVVDSYGRVTSGNTADNNTWRGIKVNGTNFLTDTSTALNLSGGNNVTLTTGSTGLLTISATDTKYTAATAAPGKVATNSASGTSANYARQDHTHGIDLATGDSNGQVKIAGTNVSVKGLGTAAYKAEGYFASSGHTHNNYLPLTGGTMSGSVDFQNYDMYHVAWIDDTVAFTVRTGSDNYQTNIECHPRDKNMNHYIRLSTKEANDGSWYQDSLQMKFSDSSGVEPTMHNIIVKRCGTDASSLEFGVPGNVGTVVSTLQGQNVRLMCYDGSTSNCCMTSNKLGRASFGSFDSRVFTYQLNVIGDVGATAYNNTSDMRLKDVIVDTELTVEQIANAPSFKFKWKDDRFDDNIHVGSSAQYWKEIIPEAVTESVNEETKETILSMQYGVVGLLSSISLAKEVKALNEKVKELTNIIDNLKKIK